MKKFTSPKQQKGELGEAIVCIYLHKYGYQILERNFTRKCGEIDIVALKGQTIHFIEVKSVSCEMGTIRPEDNMHALKQRKLARTISVYLAGHSVDVWQCDLACVYLDDATRQGRVKILDDLIL